MLNMGGLSFKNFYFILTPTEFERILEGYHLMSCTSVPVSYTETPVSEFTDTYSSLHAKLSDGEKLIDEKDWKLYPSFKITDDLSLCPYNPPHVYDGRKMKSPNFDLSVPRIEAFALVIHGGKLCKNFYQRSCAENTVGYSLCVPYRQKIYREDGSYYIEDIESGVFDGLRKRIMAITKPLKAEFYGKTLNTGIRISENAKKHAQNYYFFDLYDVKIL